MQCQFFVFRVQWQLSQLLSAHAHPSIQTLRCQCQAKEVLSKTSFETFPDLLAIHLGRGLKNGRKRQAGIQLETEIDLGPFITFTDHSRECVTFQPASGRKRRAEPDVESQDKRRRYDGVFGLWGVVCHTGGTGRAGHYVVMFKRENGDWLMQDDSRMVKMKSLPDVSKSAYLLFYNKV